MRTIAFAALAAMVTTTALAGADAYEVMRRRAPYHVQLSVKEVGAPSLAVAGRCLVRGEVARVFRGKGEAVAEGRPVILSLACRLNNTPVPMDGDVWWQVESLRAAKVVEVFLDEGAEGIHLPADRGNSLKLLNAATDHPVVREKQ